MIPMNLGKEGEVPVREIVSLYELLNPKGRALGHGGLQLAPKKKANPHGLAFFKRGESSIL